MVIQKKIGNRLIILGIVLLLCASVFAQEVDVYKESDRVLFEKVEEYLNKICFFDRLFLNIVIKKIDPSGNEYIRLEKDVSVKLIIDNNIYLRIDFTDLENPIIYLSSGRFLMLQNEAELVARIAHELVHLSSLHDRACQDITEEEYLNSEITADRIGVLVAKEIGYNPEATIEFFEWALLFYSASIAYQCFILDRLSAARKLVKEIYEAEPENKDKYKNYLYFTEVQFKAMKTIVKYLQDKYKSGK